MKYYFADLLTTLFIVLLVVAIVGAAIFAVSAITMLLWNWLMPALFGLTTINIWQSLGLLVLIQLLFKFGFTFNTTRHNDKEKGK